MAAPLSKSELAELVDFSCSLSTTKDPIDKQKSYGADDKALQSLHFSGALTLCNLWWSVRLPFHIFCPVSDLNTGHIESDKKGDKNYL